MKFKNKIFKYINPFYWINRRKNREIYFIILAAKYLYLFDIKENIYLGICTYIQRVTYNIGIKTIPEVQKYIKQLNPKFLNAEYLDSIFWWDRKDYISRNKAFDKLLDYYYKKI